VLEEGGVNTPQHSAAGVADGVGGWAEMGVDAGLYSKALMKWTHQVCEYIYIYIYIYIHIYTHTFK